MSKDRYTPKHRSEYNRKIYKNSLGISKQKCKCGCGKFTVLYRGKPREYINTHFNVGIRHPLWKGEKVSYASLHKWVSRWLGRPKICSECKTTTAKKYEWANISGKYKRILSDWIRLCVKCHHIKDKIIERGMVTKRNKKLCLS